MLMVDEINAFQCDKCTVIQSTIPTLAKRLNEFIIPILDSDFIKEITCLTQFITESGLVYLVGPNSKYNIYVVQIEEPY